MPTRAYLRLDPEFLDRKEHYPDGALAALVGVFCLAEGQPIRGYFKNLRILKVLLGRRARWVAHLLQHHDLVQLLDGRIYVEGWEEWQEGDWKVSERVARIRARRTTSTSATVNATLEVTSRAVTPLQGGGGGGGAGGGGGGVTRPELPGKLTARQRDVVQAIGKARGQHWIDARVQEAQDAGIRDVFGYLLDLHRGSPRPAGVAASSLRSDAEEIALWQLTTAWREGNLRLDELLPGKVQDAYREHLATLTGDPSPRRPLGAHGTPLEGPAEPETPPGPS